MKRIYLTFVFAGAVCFQVAAQNVDVSYHLTKRAKPLYPSGNSFAHDCKSKESLQRIYVPNTEGSHAQSNIHNAFADNH